MTCKHFYNCAHYCALTDSCDYLLDTKKRRPNKSEFCPGYPFPSQRRFKPLLLSALIPPRSLYGGRQINV